MGKKCGSQGGKRSLESMTPEERSARKIGGPSGTREEGSQAQVIAAQYTQKSRYIVERVPSGPAYCALVLGSDSRKRGKHKVFHRADDQLTHRRRDAGCIPIHPTATA